MNRHARHALLTPVLISAVALPPTTAAMAAQAAPAAAPAAAPQASCQLVVAPGTNPVEYDLVLKGLKANQRVLVTGPERFSLTADNMGSATNEDVKKGSYTVHFGKKNAIDCGKAPRPAAAPRITGVDITGASTNPAEVDCTVQQSVTFEGKLTGTGTGDVDYKWASGGRQTAPTLKFTAPSTATANFVVKSPTHAPGTPAPQVTATLTAGNASDTFTFTLKCKAGT